ncbi:MAG: hypothetical protein Q4C48_03300 [Lachnospiraceae bacterium]|nr:hypothetical protein [Lachnospiraceae bacterium]
MSVDLDNRRALIKLINQMNDDDVQRMLVYAAGYEAGKIGKICYLEQKRKQQNLDDNYNKTGVN